MNLRVISKKPISKSILSSTVYHRPSTNRGLHKRIA